MNRAPAKSPTREPPDLLAKRDTSDEPIDIFTELEITRSTGRPG
jgi:hypothetical protein